MFSRKNSCGLGKYLYPTTSTIDRGQYGDGKSHPWVANADSKVERWIGNNALVTQ